MIIAFYLLGIRREGGVEDAGRATRGRGGGGGRHGPGRGGEVADGGYVAVVEEVGKLGVGGDEAG